MRRLHLSSAFCFDAHFAEQGLRVLPERTWDRLGEASTVETAGLPVEPHWAAYPARSTIPDDPSRNSILIR
jgi:hypothetical protein